MAARSRVKYLKVDRGRFFYQRRVPKDLQSLLDEKMWLRPCGDVTYSKAVQLVVTWAEEHDKLIEELKSPDAHQQHAAKKRRNEQAIINEFDAEKGGTPLWSFPGGFEAGKFTYEEGAIPDWRWAQSWLAILEQDRRPDRPRHSEKLQLLARIHRTIETGKEFPPLTIPPYDEFKALISTYENYDFINKISFTDTLPEPMDDGEFHDELIDIYEMAFGQNSPPPPNDPDERDDYNYVRKKIERKISELTPNPNTLSSLTERYCDFNSIRPETRKKYRRDIGRLTSLVGDIPISHVGTADLKMLRDMLSCKMKPASLHAVFTPIKGIFRFAAQEGFLEYDPMSAVALPRDKRPIEERKWHKFTPAETSRIDLAIKEIWGNSISGLSDERRVGLTMVVRTLMFSGMRPIEVLRLTPEDVDSRCIQIRGSKTESSTRVVPLHPELKELPAWIKGGGMATFGSIQTDRVSSVRHNFSRLIRVLMPIPINDEKKALYSLRSTFVNAMRRSGADIQMQRAILGHKEAGAIRHYDDGPEFELKYRAVAKTDPRRN